MGRQLETMLRTCAAPSRWWVLGVLPLVLQRVLEVLSLSLPPAQPYMAPNEPEPQLSKHAVSERTPMILPRVF